MTMFSKFVIFCLLNSRAFRRVKPQNVRNKENVDHIKRDKLIHVIFVIRRVFVCMELSSKLELIYILYLILSFNFYINL